MNFQDFQDFRQDFRQDFFPQLNQAPALAWPGQVLDNVMFHPSRSIPIQMEPNIGLRFADNTRLRQLYQEMARNAIEVRISNGLHLIQSLKSKTLWVYKHNSLAIVAGNESTTGAAVPRHAD